MIRGSAFRTRLHERQKWSIARRVIGRELSTLNTRHVRVNMICLRKRECSAAGSLNRKVMTERLDVQRGRPRQYLEMVARSDSHGNTGRPNGLWLRA
jgi:hypothetical protein